MDDPAPDNFCTKFKKRSGTTDLGREYEDLYTANIILKCLRNESINNFQISSNDEKFGSFDDVVLETEYLNDSVKQNHTFAIQLKHVKNKTLIKDGLSGRTGNFSIQKYLNSSRQIADKVDSFILFSNIKFDVEENTTIKLNEHNLIIKTCRPHDDIIETAKSAGCYQFVSTKEKQFFNKFYLYTNQSNVKKLRKEVEDLFESMFGSVESFEAFLQFIVQWSLQEGMKDKLNKNFLKQVITIIVFSPYIKPLKLSVENHKLLKYNLLIFRCCLMMFDITILNEKALKDVRKIWSNCKWTLEKADINIIRNIYKILLTHFQRIEDLQNCLSNILLWLRKKCPLVVKANKTAITTINTLKISKIILIEPMTRIRNQLSNFLVFENYDDLKKIEKFTIASNFEFCLQGKEKEKLQKLLQNKQIADILTSNELIQMAVEDFKIGEIQKEVLPIPHIDRFLTQNIIYEEFFDNLNPDIILIITNISQSEANALLESFLYKIQIRKIEDLDNHRNDNITKLDKIIYITNKELTLTKFFEICKNLSKMVVHQMRYIKGRYEWIRSNKKTNHLKGFCEESNGIEENDLYLQTHRHNNVNIICADPGMGKSISMKNLKNLLKSWTILIQVKDHSLYFRQKNTNVDNFLKYIFEKTYKQYSIFEKQLYTILTDIGDIVLVWDGLDEIADENLKVVIDLVKNLAAKNFKQWLTSRCNLKTFLETEFDTFSRNIIEFNSEQQHNYIEKRLNCKGADLEDIKQRIQYSINLIQYNEILGIPLQVYMFTELFRQDSDKYKTLLSSIFLITDLYRYFVEEKFNLYHKTKANIDYSSDIALKYTEDNKNKRLTQYEQLAVQTYFKEEISNTTIQLQSSQTFLNDIATNGDSFGIIIHVSDEKIPGFIHNSYGEYFAACYLTKHFRHIHNFSNFIFKAGFNNIRFLFDLLLAKDCPAHIAVLYKNINILKEHLEDIKLKDIGGRNPLHLACSWGKRYLQQESTNLEDKINYDNNLDDSLNYEEIMQCLINTCDPKENDTIFCMNSLNYGDVAACLRPVLLLINKFNLDYNELSNFNNLYTLVYNSIQFDYSEIINEDTLPFISKNTEVLLKLAISQNSEKCLKKMLKDDHFKKEVNCFSGEHGTHLHNACYYGNPEIVSLLLLSGADPTITNNLGYFPIYTAALRAFPNVNVLQLLANHPFDTINKFNSFGQTPLLMACEANSENAVNLLLDYGADINLADLYGYTPLLFACRNNNSNIIELLIKRHADVNKSNNYGDRPLSVVASYGLSSSVEALIHAKADINAVNIKGNSPLHGCCWNKHVTCLRKLIEAGADVNVSNKFGFTPLHMCVRYEFEAGIEILLGAGANENIRNKYGETFREMFKRYQADSIK